MPAVRLDALTPMLLCEDVPASVAFYVDVLGFAVREKLDDVGRSGWASLVTVGSR